MLTPPTPHQRLHGRYQGPATPVGHARRDQMIRRRDRGDEGPVHDVGPDRGKYHPHAQLVAAVADAGGGPTV